MEDVVIVSAVRTPVGRYMGALKSVEAYDLAALVLNAAATRSGIDPGQVDQVIMGQSYQNGEYVNMARMGLLMLPTVFGAAVYQINILLGTLLASFLLGIALVAPDLAGSLAAQGLPGPELIAERLELIDAIGVQPTRKSGISHGLVNLENYEARIETTAAAPATVSISMSTLLMPAIVE